MEAQKSNVVALASTVAQRLAHSTPFQLSVKIVSAFNA